MTRRGVARIVKVVLTAALLGWAVTSVDADRLAAALREFDAAGIAAATVLLVLQAVLIGWRWRVVLRLLDVALRFATALRWIFVGLFFNQALPTSVGGDALRVWALQRRGTPLATAFASVAIERLTGVALLGLAVSACVPAAWNVLPAAARIGLLTAGPALLLLLVLLAGADAWPARWMPRRLASVARTLALGLRRTAASARALAGVGGLGIAAAACGVGAAVVLARDLGVGQPLAQLVVAIGGAVLVSMLPVSLGGWGVREASMVALFGMLGVAPERALAVSLAWGALQLAVALPGGVLWWFDARREPPRPDSGAAPAASGAAAAAGPDSAARGTAPPPIDHEASPCPLRR